MLLKALRDEAGVLTKPAEWRHLYRRSVSSFTLHSAPRTHYRNRPPALHLRASSRQARRPRLKAPATNAGTAPWRRPVRPASSRRSPPPRRTDPAIDVSSRPAAAGTGTGRRRKLIVPRACRSGLSTSRCSRGITCFPLLSAFGSMERRDSGWMPGPSVLIARDHSVSNVTHQSSRYPQPRLFQESAPERTARDCTVLPNQDKGLSLCLRPEYRHAIAPVDPLAPRMRIAMPKVTSFINEDRKSNLDVPSLYVVTDTVYIRLRASLASPKDNRWVKFGRPYVSAAICSSPMRRFVLELGSYLYMRPREYR